MNRKTYIPRLVSIMRLLCQYLIRYRTQIETQLGPSSAAAIAALIAACQALEALAIIFLRDDTKYPTEGNPYG